jgi:glycosyltransferase involved in cell wall biosynthesis
VKDHFFSIILPVYNRAAFLEKSISSVLSQTYSHYELIVVDDGSTDNGSQIVQSLIKQHPDKKIRYYYKENGERGAARNYGAEKAQGEVLNFFDSDDVLFSNHLLEANALLNANPKAQWLHLGYAINNENGDLLDKGPVFTAPPNRLLISGNHLSCNGVFVQRETFLSSRFNENRTLAGLEDWELWLRLASLHPLYYSNTITSSILQHQDRSVLNKNADKLIKRVTLLMDCVEQNPSLKAFMAGDRVRFKCSCTSYLSLHLALMKDQKGPALQYLFNSLALRPAFLFERRFYAILKSLF